MRSSLYSVDIFAPLEELRLSIGTRDGMSPKKIIFNWSWANQAPVCTQMQESGVSVDPVTFTPCSFHASLHTY